MARLKYVLPEEMVIEILYWLPVKTVLRFKSVCKSWLCIISDPKFIKTHVYYSQIMADKKASPLMITPAVRYYSLRPRFVSTESKFYLYMPLRVRVVGSCNGIICLADDEHCYLWNPTIMQSKQLLRFLENHETVDYTYRVQLAFGFDSICNDYKVVRFLSPRTPASVVPVLQLYSADTDAWKEIYVRDTSPSDILNHPNLKFGPVISGVLYMGHQGQLVSFNLHSEEFTVVPFPRSKVLRSDVLDFDGSVAVIQSDKKDSEISLWTLDDIRGKVSWTKKFAVHDNIHWIDSYLGSGVFFGRKEIGSRTKILYDYTKKDFKTFPARKLTAVLKYTQTFVSIKGFKPSVSVSRCLLVI